MRKTKKPIRVTRFGKPVAEVVPASPKADWIGSMKDTIEILGDVVSPANEENEWEALRDLGLLTSPLPTSVPFARELFFG